MDGMFELVILPDKVVQDGPVHLMVELGDISNGSLTLLHAVQPLLPNPLNTVEVPGGAEPGLVRVVTEGSERSTVAGGENSLEVFDRYTVHSALACSTVGGSLAQSNEVFSHLDPLDGCQGIVTFPVQCQW